MKNLNKHEDKHLGLKEKVAHVIGDKIGKISTGSNCWMFALYEPSISYDVICKIHKEYVDMQN